MSRGPLAQPNDINMHVKVETPLNRLSLHNASEVQPYFLEFSKLLAVQDLLTRIRLDYSLHTMIGMLQRGQEDYDLHARSDTYESHSL